MKLLKMACVGWMFSESPPTKYRGQLLPGSSDALFVAVTAVPELTSLLILSIGPGCIRNRKGR